MTNLPSTETMERISRQELADNLDAVLDRVLRENIGLVITDEGKDDLVLCPSSWLDPFHTEDFGSVINCALAQPLAIPSDHTASPSVFF